MAEDGWGTILSLRPFVPFVHSDGGCRVARRLDVQHLSRLRRC